MDDIRKRERGYVLVVIAGVLVILLGFATLAVDAGIMYAASTSAQRAADGAALAGAFTFILNPFATDPATVAQTRAINTAVQNTILGTPVDGNKVTVDVDVSNHLVTVNLSHTIPTFFAGVLGHKLATVSVVAYAEAAPEPTCGSCIKPWFIPNNIISTKEPCNATPPTNTACAKEELIVTFDPDTQKAVVTDFAKTFMQTQTEPFTIKPGNPENALGPGNFYAIQLSDDPNQAGGDVYRDNIAHCGLENNIKCGDLYSVKTGNMIGPTEQGTSFLITGGVSDKKNDIPDYADTWGPFIGGVASYVSTTGETKYNSRQVVVAPIWDVCHTICLTGGRLSGTNVEIQVVGFATLFLSGIQGTDVQAYLVGASGCDLNQSACDGGSVMAMPLRLVRIK